MSPLEIAAGAACAVLLMAAVTAAIAVRRLLARSRSLEAALDRLREQVEELSRREGAREAAEASGPAKAADWVITFDDQEPQTVSTQRVVGTTLGEPLLKVAAFSHGVRYALREEKRAHLAYQVRREYRRRRRVSRARARAAQGRAARERTARAAERGRSAS
jgi:hypothetical protein